MRYKQKFPILFFGSDRFSIRVLKRLLQLDVCPIEVTSSLDSQLASFAHQQKLQLHPWKQLTQCWPTSQPGLGLLASFGHMISVDIIKRLPMGLFNVHPSLLPQYRGSTPIQAAVRDGLKETGCTIMRIPPIEKFDIGEIVLQERLEIMNHEYAAQLSNRLADLGATLVEHLLTDYDDCLKLSRPQGHEGRSYAKKLRPQDGLLKFKSSDAGSLDCQVRAYSSYIELYVLCLSGLKVRLGGMVPLVEVARYDLDRLASKLISCDMAASKEGNEVATWPSPGAIYFHKLRHLLCMKSADGQWMAFHMASPVGFDSRLTSLEFFNGFLSKVGPLERWTDE